MSDIQYDRFFWYLQFVKIYNGIHTCMIYGECHIRIDNNYVSKIFGNESLPFQNRSHYLIYTNKYQNLIYMNKYQNLIEMSKYQKQN